MVSAYDVCNNVCPSPARPVETFTIKSGGSTLCTADELTSPLIEDGTITGNFWISECTGQSKQFIVILESGQYVAVWATETCSTCPDVTTTTTSTTTTTTTAAPTTTTSTTTTTTTAPPTTTTTSTTTTTTTLGYAFVDISNITSNTNITNITINSVQIDGVVFPIVAGDGASATTTEIGTSQTMVVSYNNVSGDSVEVFDTELNSTCLSATGTSRIFGGLIIAEGGTASVQMFDGSC
jgi:hypothetical protein